MNYKTICINKYVLFMVFFSIVQYGCNQNSSASKVDEEKVRAVIDKMYAESDKKNWHEVERIFADSVLMDYTSVNGGGPVYSSPRQITYKWSGFDSVLHRISDVKIKISGNTATAGWTGNTSHYFDNRSWIVDAGYDAELKRINNNWLISKYKVMLIKQEGDTSLGEAAAAKQKNNDKINTMSYSIRKEEVKINVGGSIMNAHIAYPEKEGKFSAVIVVMELFGVNDNIRDIANQIAALGYVAIAPDFYHRTKKTGDIPYGEEGRKYGFEQLNQLDRAGVLTDAGATIDYLKSRQNVAGKMGVAGFSMGGHIAFLTATQYPIAAVACFYGGWLTNTEIKLSQPEPTIMLTSGIAKHDGRVIYFAGGQDKIITKNQVDSIGDALKAANVRNEVVVYPTATHGFFCDQRPETFDRKSHDDAWKRVQELFADELQERN